MSDDECVIHILENHWREVQVDGLTELVWGVRMHDHALKEVSDDNEDIRGDRASLPKAIFTVDPGACYLLSMRWISLEEERVM